MLSILSHIKAVITLSLFFILICCQNKQKPIEIDTKEKLKTVTDKNDSASLSFAVYNNTDPEQIYREYKPLADYLYTKTNINIKLIVRNSFKDIDDLFNHGKIDFARISTGFYLQVSDPENLELMALESANGSSFFQTCIIVHNDSPIKKFEDLKGKSFAFMDSVSNSGYYYPIYLSATKNENINDFFSKTIYTGTHNKSIRAVLQKAVTGASVASYVLAEESARNPKIKSNIRIIQKSPLIVRGPIVVKKDLPDKLKEKLKTILLNMYQDKEGIIVLRSLQLDSYTKGNDSDFNSARLILNSLKEKE